MTHADVDRGGFGLGLNLVKRLLVLEVARDAVDVRALAQAVGVADRGAPAGELVVVALFIVAAVGAFRIRIAEGEHGRAAGERHVKAGLSRPALEGFVIKADRGKSKLIGSVGRALVHVVEVLSAQIGLRKAAVVVAAGSERVAVVGVVGIFRARPVVERGGRGEIERTGHIGAAESGVARVARLAFSRSNRVVFFAGAELVLRVHAEGILSVSVEARKVRGLVGDGVVHAGAAHIVRAEFNSVGPRSAEGREIAEKTVGAVGAVKGAEMTEGEFAEGAANEEVRFTAEETATLSDRAVVERKAVFEHEADAHAVAEVFNALEAEAAAGLVAGRHGEGVGSVLARLTRIGVKILDADVDDAVNGYVSGHGRTRKSAEDGECSKSLFHFYVSWKKRFSGRALL